MKRYSFRLQSVLRSRVIVEERDRAEMLAASARLETAKNRVEQIQSSLDESIDRSGSGVVVAHEMQFQRDQFERFGRELAAAKAELVERSGEYDVARFVWSEAKSKVTMLERLDEQQRETWRTETLKTEQDLTDEVAMVHSRSGAFA